MKDTILHQVCKKVDDQVWKQVYCIVYLRVCNATNLFNNNLIVSVVLFDVLDNLPYIEKSFIKKMDLESKNEK